MRGFDIFMRAARLIARECPDVLFVVVGSDRVCYGGDAKHIRHATFREHVLAGADYDMSKFLFTGVVPVSTLVDILSLSDLHIYLTVPFVLSWSMMDALACGCTVLASNTAPVVEMIAEGENGLLVDFFDVEGLARRAVEVLRDPPAFRLLGERAAELITERYALGVTLPKLLSLFERVVRGTKRRAKWRSRNRKIAGQSPLLQGRCASVRGFVGAGSVRRSEDARVVRRQPFRKMLTSRSQRGVAATEIGGQDPVIQRPGASARGSVGAGSVRRSEDVRVVWRGFRRRIQSPAHEIGIRRSRL